MLLFIVAAVLYATVSNSPFSSDRKAFAAPVNGLSMPATSASAPAQIQSQAVLRPSTINQTIRQEQPALAAPAAPDLQAFAAPAEPTATATAEPIANQEDAVVRAAAEAPPPILPAYQVYQAQEGDSVYAVAEKFGILPEYIIANNAELAATEFMSLGQSIIIPAGNGILHEVRYGETLSDISARYDVNVDDITGFAGNGIADPNSVLETQTVFVPNATILPAVPFEDPVADGSADTGDGTTEDGPGDGSDSGDGAVVDTGPASSAGLVWPVVGPISSPYGPSHPLGIDVDGYNLGGAAIVAATSGTVVFAGGNACCSYGLYVVIQSPEGIETLYAHLSSIDVVQGQTVSQGEAIGVIGDTGYSTGVHLHFEVIDNGVRQNPLAYLP
ncbi:MAG: LysM peptidoglycan-binding domain-containing M23 family metallopeptidase [Chloroflexi bacterium]|nr:LysM peptidoglycan-binding domain-containing M23 family metallopeptidase [Chloroflexota bacterium]